MPNTPLSWDYLLCQVVFKHTGIELNTWHFPAETPDFTQIVLSDVSMQMLTSENDVALLRRLAAIAEKGAANRVPNKAEVRPEGQDFRLSALTEISFRPHIIGISSKRATQFMFFTDENTDWLFDYPGVYPESPLPPAFGIFGNQTISLSRHVVEATFVPNQVKTQFKYNLRLDTTVTNNGLPDGHAIIIIDPIIELGKD